MSIIKSVSNSISKSVLALLFVLVLTNCGDSQQQQTVHPAITFESGDECHVCGMIITRLPGPKGQAFDKRSNNIKKFCSTLDLISWYLQPDNKPNIAEVYVHDMAQTDWESPDDTKLIPAKKAFFVIGSNKKAAMGKTIASFSTRKDAEQFQKKWQGKILKFDQLSIDIILEN